MTERRKGMTLIEIMVAIFISTIVLSAIYGVWMRVQRQIAKSSARQTLQNELRAISNNMQKDFKAIKEGTFEAPPGEQSADGTRMKIAFDRFKESDEGKIAQDSITRVEYELANGMLVRKSDDSLKILSTNLDSVVIAKSVDEGALSATDLEATDKDFKAGREAMLDIAIAGKRRVAGSREEIFHLERTSLVMRDEYYKKTNKTYVSNFDLAKLETDDVMKADSTQDANFGPGQAYTREMLESLDVPTLNGMKDAQKDLMEQAQEAFDRVNDNMNDTDTGHNVWDSLAFWSDSEGEIVDDMRDDLVDADTYAETETAMKKLDEYAAKKEESFLSRSIPGWGGLSQDQKMVYKQAYDMKVQDRAIKAMNAQAKEADPNAEEQPYMIDLATTVENQTFEDESGTTTISASDNDARQAESEALKSAYDSVSLDWMGEFGDETEEVQAYNAAKSLINDGRSKLYTIELRDKSKANIELIDSVIASK
ncbi:MAG: prepilin-type N-terminal cleavage/methylation domain-containing protein [Candidatus Riflebacteria bacterium]